MKSFFIVGLIIILSGCAVMDTSVLETAETLEKGHFEFSVDTGTGIDLADAVAVSSDDDHFLDAEELIPAPVMGLNLGLGLADDLQANFKTWASVAGGGGRFSLKNRLTKPSDSTFVWAVMPGLNYLRSDIDMNDGYLDYECDIEVIGFEIPLLYSRRLYSHLDYFGAFRYGYDNIQINSIDGEDIEGEYELHRFGLYQGLGVRFGWLIFRSEIGFDTVMNEDSEWGFVPTVNMRVGLGG